MYITQTILNLIGQHSFKVDTYIEIYTLFFPFVHIVWKAFHVSMEFFDPYLTFNVVIKFMLDDKAAE